MSIAIGVDVGGTKIRALLARDGAITDEAVAPGGAVRAGRTLAAASRIAAVIRSVLLKANALEADAVVVGAAGVGREGERKELTDYLRRERVTKRLQVTTDVEIALEDAFGSAPGIIVLSGTGSIAIARLAAGGEALHRVGGLGWQLGDEGGGYWMGRAILLAVGRAQEQRGPATLLTEDTLAATRSAAFNDLVTWAGNATPYEVANLTRLLTSRYAEGDGVARSIIDQAADELSLLVQTLLRRFPEKGKIPVALSGGNLAAGGPLRAQLGQRWRALPRIEILEVVPDGARGAVTQAVRLLSPSTHT